VFIEPVEEGDVIVLCSDGLSGKVSTDEIGKIAGAKSPAQAAWDLVDLANERGGNDNITVLVASVREIEKVNENEKPARSEKKRGIGRLLGRK
jgi:protein phosphatase